MFLLILCAKVPGISENTGLPHFIVPQRYCVFYKLEVYGNTELSKSVGTTSKQHLLTPCLLVTFWLILEIFQTLHQQKSYDTLRTQMRVIGFQ